MKLINTHDLLICEFVFVLPYIMVNYLGTVTNCLLLGQIQIYQSQLWLEIMAINTNNDDINNTMFTNFHTLTTNYNNEGNNLIAFMTFIN